MHIEITSLTDAQIEEKNIRSWPVWACGISQFDWEYSAQETCLLLEGEVEVSSEFETVRFTAGDYIVFPRGLKCLWKVIRPVRKHYSLI